MQLRRNNLCSFYLATNPTSIISVSSLSSPCHLERLTDALSRELAISWLFFRLGLSLPHIVAGENLNMPVVGPALAKCGAFFIRRSFGNDPIYNTVVKDYIEQLLANGANSESFLDVRARSAIRRVTKLTMLTCRLRTVECFSESSIYCNSDTPKINLVYSGSQSKDLEVAPESYFHLSSES